MPEAAPLLAGGRLLGAFGYASFGTSGWRVAQRTDVGGLTDDAVTEGARLIERLPWWPDEPLAAGVDPYERPRRLAWLGTGTTPRRFLLHTIHAENDASNRPDNNFTECLVVERLDAVRAAETLPTGKGDEAQPQREQASRVDVRPSQLWDLGHWVTPWGAEEVAAVRPGGGTLAGLTRPDDVLEVILTDRTGQARLRSLLAAVHHALHRTPARPVLGIVDNLIWGAGLLDTVMSLLPERTAWDATFDLRSLGPAARLAGRGAGQAPALVTLHGIDHHGHAPATTAVDLTSDTDPEELMTAVLPEARQDCPQCGQWYASVDRLLGQEMSVDPQQLNRQLQRLREGERRLDVRVPTARPVAPMAGASGDAPAAPMAMHGGRTTRTPPAGAGFETAPAVGRDAEAGSGTGVELADLDRFLARLRSGRAELASQADPHLARLHLLHLWRWTRVYAGEQIAALEPPSERGTAEGSEPSAPPAGLDGWAARQPTGVHRPRWPSSREGSERW